MRRRKDDSNKFVVSITMFNRTMPSELLVAIAVLSGYAALTYIMWKKI